MPRLSDRSSQASAGPKAPQGVSSQQQQQQGKGEQPRRSKPALAQHAVAPLRPLTVPPPPDHPFLKAPREYRQADGTLASTKPPPNPYTVASRRAWEDIVRYARLTTSSQTDKAKDGTQGTTYRSFRHGDGVSYEAHALYLKQLGMEPERNADGTWNGFDPARQDPLRDDERHPLHAVRLSPLSSSLTADAAA